MSAIICIGECTEIHFQNGRKEDGTNGVRSPPSIVARVSSAPHQLRGGGLMFSK